MFIQGYLLFILATAIFTTCLFFAFIVNVTRATFMYLNLVSYFRLFMWFFMLSTDFIIAVAMMVQPPFFGFLFFSVSKSGVVSRFFFSYLKTTRKRFKSVKFFECAAYSRLLNHIQYDMHALSFCILFILYDVDLIFFFTEATSFDRWGTVEFFFVFFNFFLLSAGLWYDYIRSGFNWSY